VPAPQGLGSEREELDSLALAVLGSGVHLAAVGLRGVVRLSD
jgi:hypothetical protein